MLMYIFYRIIYPTQKTIVFRSGFTLKNIEIILCIPNESIYCAWQWFELVVCNWGHMKDNFLYLLIGFVITYTLIKMKYHPSSTKLHVKVTERMIKNLLRNRERARVVCCMQNFILEYYRRRLT